MPVPCGAYGSTFRTEPSISINIYSPTALSKGTYTHLTELIWTIWRPGQDPPCNIAASDTLGFMHDSVLLPSVGAGMGAAADFNMV